MESTLVHALICFAPRPEAPRSERVPLKSKLANFVGRLFNF